MMSNYGYKKKKNRSRSYLKLDSFKSVLVDKVIYKGTDISLNLNNNLPVVQKFMVLVKIDILD